MISKDNPAGKTTRGTIEVYSSSGAVDGYPAEWFYRVKSKNGQKLSQGEGYGRRDRCLSTLDVLYGSRLTETGTFVVGDLVIPWRLVVEKRDGTVDWIGQIL